MNCCQCTCENPTCSCTPVEVTAFKDSNGNLHSTQKGASISSIVSCVRNTIPCSMDYRSCVSYFDIEKVVKALSDLNLLKID